MNILITGGCGFVGTNIALYLHKKGHKIYSLDNLSRKGSKYNLKLLNEEKILNYKYNIFGFTLYTCPKFLKPVKMIWIIKMKRVQFIFLLINNIFGY